MTNVKVTLATIVTPAKIIIPLVWTMKTEVKQESSRLLYLTWWSSVASGHTIHLFIEALLPPTSIETALLRNFSSNIAGL